MLVNEATQVREMLLQKLREANLSNVLREDLSQFLDMEDHVFIEVVLSDGAELERVEAIVAELREALQVRGTRVDPVVRTVWEVADVKDHGTAYGKDGAPRAAHEFCVTLKSGSRFETAVVEITWGTMHWFRQKLGGQTTKGKTEEKRVAEELVAIIRRFAEDELRQGGTSYWDPLKYPRRELNELAIAFLSERRE